MFASYIPEQVVLRENEMRREPKFARKSCSTSLLSRFTIEHREVAGKQYSHPATVALSNRSGGHVCVTLLQYRTNDPSLPTLK